MLHRRQLLALALAGLLPRTGTAAAAAKAKRVIWIFLCGGLSHLESFDPKPLLNRYAGKTIAETPHAAVLQRSFTKENIRVVIRDDNGHVRPTLFPLQVGCRPRGQSGTLISDWWPHVGACVDDLAIVRSLWTTDNNHGAALQFHTGRHQLDGNAPSLGAWVHYALGTLNDNLPRFVVLGSPSAGGPGMHGSDYLGPLHTAVPLRVEGEPLAFAKTPGGVSPVQRERELRMLGTLNGLTATAHPGDAQLTARMRSYELAARMQLAVPETLNLDAEPKAMQTLYGLDNPATAAFGRSCLAARRLSERGVRFVQLLHEGNNGGPGGWDSHTALRVNHTRLCGAVDGPIAGLLTDLKQRGMFDDTLVVCATEFGRSPGSQGSDGRDHHPFGFSCWLAGGGVKRGTVHGATDELGFHAVENRHYVTDVHATVLHLLGVDWKSLEIAGHKRQERDLGTPIAGIVA